MKKNNLSKTEKALQKICKVYTNGSLEPFRKLNFQNDDFFDLSLIVPVYNSEKSITRCLNSLVNQTTSFRYEIVLVDDGSKDSSLRICRDFEKLYNNITCYSQENKGVSCARNKGIELSKGLYIGFVDNDDHLDELYVETLMHEALDYDIDFVKCSFASCINNSIDKIFSGRSVRILGSVSADLIMDYNSYIWGGVYKKSLWNDISLPEGFWFEDMCTRFIVLRKAKSFSYVDKPLYLKEEHKNNASRIVWSSSSYKALDQLFLVMELVKLNDRLGLPRDSSLLRILLHEYGFVLWGRIKKLPLHIVRAALSVASSVFLEVYECVDDNGLKLTKEETEYLSALKNANWIKWYYLSMKKLLHIV